MNAIDLFAGCGGSTTGATQAGVNVLVAANHWQVAVDCHQANHPGVQHQCQDLQQADFHKYPDHDILMASPACQGHSSARGGERSGHDVTRATAWAVIAAAEAKSPAYIVVENVLDFIRWNLFPQWKACLKTLGYFLTMNEIDSADLGAPQSRKRLFVVGSKKGPVEIPKGAVAHVPASSIIDEKATNWSLINKAGRASSTLGRIGYARSVQGLGSRFLLAYFGKEKGGRSLDRPIGTITTRDRYCLVDGDYMRTLSSGEYKAAMGFDASYQLPNSHKQAVHLAGNAVVPAVMKHVINHVKKHALTYSK